MADLSCAINASKNIRKSYFIGLNAIAAILSSRMPSEAFS